MEYRYRATSIEGFVQQLAISYIGHGYWYYVTGMIPDDKDRNDVDVKLIERYGCGISKWARARRRRAGLANVHYIRYESFFVLIASGGEHKFFEDERQYRDIRRDAIGFHGYSIGYHRGEDRRWHPSVRIHPKEYDKFRAYLLGLACSRSVENLARVFRQVPFEPYAPVRRQLLNLRRLINLARNLAGFEEIPITAIRFQRRIVRPFDEQSLESARPPKTSRVKATRIDDDAMAA